MNRTQWYQHWHNIRSSSKPRNYGVASVTNLRFAGEPMSEVAYGYNWGAMSIMQQPKTQRKKCPICGVIRKDGVYCYFEKAGELGIPSCNVCHPPIKCPTCGGRCSEYELQCYNGSCCDCYRSNEEE